LDLIGKMIKPITRNVWGNIASDVSGTSRSQSWSPQYWVAQSECYELWHITGSGDLIGLKRGDILTVGGSAGSYTFQVPNTAPYQTYDTDKIWFKSDLVQRTVTEAEIVGFDFAGTIVKYLSATPYTPDYIMILSSAFASANENKMRDEFLLSIWWSNVLSSYGVVKDNRGIGQSVFLPESAPPSDLALTVLSSSSIKADFTDNSGGLATHSIERSTTNESGYAEAHVDAAGVVTWTDTTNSASTKYYYRVRAHNATGYSSYCTSANATTTSAMIVYDTFTGADTTHLNAHTKEIGGAWTEDSGTWTIVSNAVNFVKQYDQIQSVHCESGESDQDISLDITMPNSNSYDLGIAFRFQDLAHHWLCVIARDAGGTPYCAIAPIGGGTAGDFTTGNITQENGVTHTLRLVAKGTTCTAYWNGVQKVTGTISDGYMAGKTKVGIGGYITDAYVWSPVDNFIVYKAL
jgi:hypothetical protein